MAKSKSLFITDMYHKVTSYVLTYEKTYERFPTFAEVMRQFKISEADARMYSLVAQNIQYLDLSTDSDLRLAVRKLSASLTKCRDRNRWLSADSREHDRLPNALEELSKAQVELLKQYQYHDPISARSKAELIKNLGSIKDGVGIIHISDPHLNEKVDIDGINVFNIERGSKMLRKLVTEAIFDFKAQGFRHVLVVCTGDILNSDRRLDEKLNMATNRTKAKFIATDIFRGMLLELADHFDNVYFAGVSGNESRISEELGSSEIMVTDNYDYDVYQTLQFLYAGHPKIHVLEQDNYSEYPILVAGQWILLTHGMQRTLQGDVEKGVIQMVGKWADHGYKISFILFGHLHYTRIGDHFARGASWVGANAYSNRTLQLITKPAQLLHYVYSNGDIYNKRIDLVNVDKVVPYAYNKDLESYNSKSALKTKKGRTILQIKI